MFGPFSKAFTAFSTGLINVIGLVITANLLQGKWLAYAAIAVSVLTWLVGTVAVFKVPNTAANLAYDEQVAPKVIADGKAVVAQIQADLHAGAAQAAPWVTATPPPVKEPNG